MHKNVGVADMYFRLIVGAIFLLIGLLNNPVISDGIPKIIIAVIGGIVITSALIRNCPLYYLAGINTDNKKEK